MATKHTVHYRIAGGKSYRRNVVTRKSGTLDQCRDEITRIIADEYEVQRSDLPDPAGHAGG